jgi:hypothetical protein
MGSIEEASVQQANKQSAVVFLRRSELPERKEVEAALATISGSLVTWHEEHELENTRALSLLLEGQHIAVSIIGAAIDPEMYGKILDDAGLAPEDREVIESHGSHARVISMKSDEVFEPADRMWLVYRVAARLSGLDGGAILAPASGVFVLGLDTEYVDSRRDDNVPPMDLWVQVVMEKSGEARSIGASVVGVPEVSLSEITGMDPEEIFTSIMGTLVYIRQIRRPLVTGESLHIGNQYWEWKVVSNEDELVRLQRVPLKLNIPSQKGEPPTM